MQCSDLNDEDKKNREKMLKIFKLPKQINKLLATCETNLEDLKDDEIIVMCAESCKKTLPDGFPAFYKVPETENYTSDSSVCSAAMD